MERSDIDRSEGDVSRRGAPGGAHQIAAIPKLFEQLDIAGHLVSVDAMGTHTAITADIRSKDVDYLMAVKRNEGSLHDEVVDQFHSATTQSVRQKSPAWDLHEQLGKANGRITTRRVAVTGQLDWILSSIRKRWRDLATLIMVESESYDITAKKTYWQKSFYISSKAASTEQFSRWIRGHWSIENGCHGVLDTLYREDHSQVRIANAVKNFAILRRIAHNLHKSDNTSMKFLPMKQMRAMVDDHYRNRLLSLAG